MATNLATLALTIDGVTVSEVVSCDIESLLGEEVITADADASEQRTWTLKDGNCSCEYLYDVTPDAGQQDIQDDYDTPATSVYVLTRGGTRTFTFTAFPKSIKHTGGPGNRQRVQVTWAVTGGVATA